LADVIYKPGSTTPYADADNCGKDFMKVSLHSNIRSNRRGARLAP